MKLEPASFHTWKNRSRRFQSSDMYLLVGGSFLRNRGSRHFHLSPLGKKNFVPKVRTPQSMRSASLMARWENLLETKQDSKLLLADLCLTSVWHLGTLAHCDGIKPCFLVHLINNHRSICLSFALQIYCLLFLINGSRQHNGPNHSCHKFKLITDKSMIFFLTKGGRTAGRPKFLSF